MFLVLFTRIMHSEILRPSSRERTKNINQLNLISVMLFWTQTVMWVQKHKSSKKTVKYVSAQKEFLCMCLN